MADEYVVQMPDVMAKGYCRACGDPLPDGYRKLTCENCLSTEAREKAAAKATGKSVAARTKSSPSSGGKVTNAKAAGSFAKLAVIISAIWAWSAVKRYGIPDPDSQLAESLAFTDEEAADIARPLGRVAMGNSTTAKLVGPIVENDDLIDAAFAIWEWRKRVDATLAQYKGHVTQDNRRQVNVAPQPDEASPADGGGYNPLEHGYDANRDARVIA